MQPVLLGRSFAPLQGETGLCTVATCSSRQKHRASVSLLRRGETKGMHFFPPRQEVRVNSEGPECFFSSEENIVVLICNFICNPIFVLTGGHIRNVKSITLYVFIYIYIHLESVLHLP